MNLVFRSRAAWYYHDLITYFVEFPLGDFTAKFVVSRAVRFMCCTLESTLSDKELF